MAARRVLVLVLALLLAEVAVSTAVRVSGEDEDDTTATLQDDIDVDADLDDDLDEDLDEALESEVQSETETETETEAVAGTTPMPRYNAWRDQLTAISYSGLWRANGFATPVVVKRGAILYHGTNVALKFEGEPKSIWTSASAEQAIYAAVAQLSTKDNVGPNSPVRVYRIDVIEDLKLVPLPPCAYAAPRVLNSYCRGGCGFVNPLMAVSNKMIAPIITKFCASLQGHGLHGWRSPFDQDEVMVCGHALAKLILPGFYQAAKREKVGGQWVNTRKSINLRHLNSPRGGWDSFKGAALSGAHPGSLYVGALPGDTTRKAEGAAVVSPSSLPIWQCGSVAHFAKWWKAEPLKVNFNKQRLPTGVTAAHCSAPRGSPQPGLYSYMGLIKGKGGRRFDMHNLNRGDCGLAVEQQLPALVVAIPSGGESSPESSPENRPMRPRRVGFTAPSESSSAPPKRPGTPPPTRRGVGFRLPSDEETSPPTTPKPKKKGVSFKD